MYKRRKKFSPVKVVAVGFAILILIGGLILCTPFASSDGSPTNFIDSIFTATSAVCVTGLAVKNTALHWSAFGKGVILALIQIGGLGFMSVATFISFALRRRVSLKERMLLAEMLNRSEIQGIVKLTRNLLLGTFIIEGIGALILSLRFMADYSPLEAVAKGVFHSISAFCNAGFDLFGDVEGNSSLALYARDPIVNITIMLLVILGGLGFFVWMDIINARRGKKLSTHSRIVLSVSLILLVVGAVAVYIFEYSNPDTLGKFSTGEKILAAFFQSVTCRTAGFETVSQASLTLPSKLISAILMFIGGSPGSTAGGIKTVTFAVLVASALSMARGREHTNIFKRRIPLSVIRRSLSIVMLGVAVVFVSLVAISYLEPALSLEDVMYEVVSAFATVGLSCSVTPTLCVASKILVAVLMYFGRIGILTFGMALAQKADGSEDLYMYADANISVG